MGSAGEGVVKGGGMERSIPAGQCAPFVLVDVAGSERQVWIDMHVMYVPMGVTQRLSVLVV